MTTRTGSSRRQGMDTLVPPAAVVTYTVRWLPGLRIGPPTPPPRP